MKHLSAFHPKFEKSKSGSYKTTTSSGSRGPKKSGSAAWFYLLCVFVDVVAGVTLEEPLHVPVREGVVRVVGALEGVLVRSDIHYNLVKHGEN